MDDHQERLKKKTSPFVFFLIKCVKSIWWRPEKAFNFLSRGGKKGTIVAERKPNHMKNPSDMKALNSRSKQHRDQIILTDAANTILTGC